MEFPISGSENQFFCVIFNDHQEEIDAPFIFDCTKDFFILEGMQSGQKVQMIIPREMECYFEIRSL